MIPDFWKGLRDCWKDGNVIHKTSGKTHFHQGITALIKLPFYSSQWWLIVYRLSKKWREEKISPEAFFFFSQRRLNRTYTFLSIFLFFSLLKAKKWASYRREISEQLWGGFNFKKGINDKDHCCHFCFAASLKDEFWLQSWM